MTASKRLSRPLGLVVLAALILVFMPVETVYANESAPETRSAQLEDLTAESSEVVERPLESESAVSEDGDLEASADQAPEKQSESADAEASDDAPVADLEDDASAEVLATPESDVTAAPEAAEESVALLRERSEVLEAPLPFTGLGLTGPGPEAPNVYYRALLEDGNWSDWETIEALDAFDGPDPGSDEAREAEASTGDRWVSEAIWVGPATHLQLQIEGGALSELDVTVIDSAGLSESLLAKAKRTVLSMGTAAPAEADVSQPNIRPRSAWMASNDGRCESGRMSTATPRAAVLHHTATTNNYSREQAAQQIRNMYHWHTGCNGSGNGWSDLGYNFVVDRFGTIWEGRRGGITNGVIGAHAGGWNTGTIGVALMGHHGQVAPSSASLDAAAELLAWKYDLHGIDASPTARATVNGQSIPILVGHRNVRGSYTANPSGTTDCPGQLMYTRMGGLRQSIESATGDWAPVVGDWNRDGRTTTGWFRDGTWRLRNSNSGGSETMNFTFGSKGDIPVVGDWNGDGRTTVGIVRDGQWHLRNNNSSGSAHHTFWYGRGAIDWPMAGDWNGNGRDTPAIVRDGEWHLRNSLSNGSGDIVFTYGRITQGDIPVVGDWNRNGRDTPGILRNGEWHLRNTHRAGSADNLFIYGRLTQGDTPVVGDWNRDGQTTVGVTRDGVWHLRNQLSGGSASVTFTFK